MRGRIRMPAESVSLAPAAIRRRRGGRHEQSALSADEHRVVEIACVINASGIGLAGRRQRQPAARVPRHEPALASIRSGCRRREAGGS